MSEQRYVLVAGYNPGDPPYEVKCNESEWLASQMRKGDTCWFRLGERMHRSMGRQWRRGTFRGSYLYDGVIAKVHEDDPDDLIEHSLFLGIGDELSAVAP